MPSSTAKVEGLPNLVRHHVSLVTGEACCAKAIKPVRRTGEVRPYFGRLKAPPNARALVRTGCIPCLRDGVKCDGSYPQCRKSAISEDWCINSDTSLQWHGSWRQRRGMNMFMRFSLAPEQAGMFESAFWHKTLLQACFYDDAVFCVASAIGALQEHILQQSPVRAPVDSEGLTFALRQCNRAINLLTRRTNFDPGIALITCVLFTIFEALNGDTEQAISHSLQACKLLDTCEALANREQRTRLIEPSTIRPVISGLEIQAKALQGKNMDVPDFRGMLPLPNARPIYSLEHANATLHYAYVSLLVFCQSLSLGDAPFDISLRMHEKFQHFQPWLLDWEENFAAYLSREVGSLSHNEVQRAKVLKANHLTATLLATVDQGAGRDSWRGYDAQCKATIDLSASVLDAYSTGPHATLSTFQFPFLTFGLWVAEPLFIVMARCNNAQLRRQAAGLLSGQARPNGAPLIARKSLGVILEPGSVQKDTDGWDLAQWIDFCSHTRLDAAMATYFALLPSGYIDKPVYEPCGVKLAER